VFFLFVTSRLAVVPTQLLIQSVTGDLSAGVNRIGHEDDHSPPSGAEIKAGWSRTSTPHASSWRGAELRNATKLLLLLRFILIIVIN
jgi:hypothetical protein